MSSGNEQYNNNTTNIIGTLIADGVSEGIRHLEQRLQHQHHHHDKTTRSNRSGGNTHTNSLVKKYNVDHDDINAESGGGGGELVGFSPVSISDDQHLHSSLPHRAHQRTRRHWNYHHDDELLEHHQQQGDGFWSSWSSSREDLLGAEKSQHHSHTNGITAATSVCVESAPSCALSAYVPSLIARVALPPESAPHRNPDDAWLVKRSDIERSSIIIGPNGASASTSIVGRPAKSIATTATTVSMATTSIEHMNVLHTHRCGDGHASTTDRLEVELQLLVLTDTNRDEDEEARRLVARRDHNSSVVDGLVDDERLNYQNKMDIDEWRRLVRHGATTSLADEERASANHHLTTTTTIVKRRAILKTIALHPLLRFNDHLIFGINTLCRVLLPLGGGNGDRKKALRELTDFSKEDGKKGRSSSSPPTAPMCLDDLATAVGNWVARHVYMFLCTFLVIPLLAFFQKWFGAPLVRWMFWILSMFQRLFPHAPDPMYANEALFYSEVQPQLLDFLEKNEEKENTTTPQLRMPRSFHSTFNHHTREMCILISDERFHQAHHLKTTMDCKGRDDDGDMALVVKAKQYGHSQNVNNNGRASSGAYFPTPLTPPPQHNLSASSTSTTSSKAAVDLVKSGLDQLALLHSLTFVQYADQQQSNNNPYREPVSYALSTDLLERLPRRTTSQKKNNHHQQPQYSMFNVFNSPLGEQLIRSQVEMTTSHKKNNNRKKKHPALPPLPDVDGDKQRHIEHTGLTLDVILENLWRSQQLLDSDEVHLGGHHCLLHGDPHVGNSIVYPPSTTDNVTGETQNTTNNSCNVGFFDFQLSAIGHPALDVCYYITTALSVEDRREHEDDLIICYGACLEKYLTLWEEAADESHVEETDEKDVDQMDTDKKASTCGGKSADDLLSCRSVGDDGTPEEMPTTPRNRSQEEVPVVTGALANDAEEHQEHQEEHQEDDNDEKVTDSSSSSSSTCSSNSPLDQTSEWKDIQEDDETPSCPFPAANKENCVEDSSADGLDDGGEETTQPTALPPLVDATVQEEDGDLDDPLGMEQEQLESPPRQPPSSTSSSTSSSASPDDEEREMDLCATMLSPSPSPPRARSLRAAAAAVSLLGRFASVSRRSPSVETQEETTTATKTTMLMNQGQADLNASLNKLQSLVSSLGKKGGVVPTEVHDVVVEKEGEPTATVATTIMEDREPAIGEVILTPDDVHMLPQPILVQDVIEGSSSSMDDDQPPAEVHDGEQDEEATTAAAVALDAKRDELDSDVALDANDELVATTNDLVDSTTSPQTFEVEACDEDASTTSNSNAATSNEPAASVVVEPPPLLPTTVLEEEHQMNTTRNGTTKHHDNGHYSMDDEVTSNAPSSLSKLEEDGDREVVTEVEEQDHEATEQRQQQPLRSPQPIKTSSSASRFVHELMVGKPSTSLINQNMNKENMNMSSTPMILPFKDAYRLATLWNFAIGWLIVPTVNYGPTVTEEYMQRTSSAVRDLDPVSVCSMHHSTTK